MELRFAGAALLIVVVGGCSTTNHIAPGMSPAVAATVFVQHPDRDVVVEVAHGKRPFTSPSNEDLLLTGATEKETVVIPRHWPPPNATSREHGQVPEFRIANSNVTGLTAKDAEAGALAGLVVGAALTVAVAALVGATFVPASDEEREAGFALQGPVSKGIVTGLVVAFPLMYASHAVGKLLGIPEHYVFR